MIAAGTSTPPQIVTRDHVRHHDGSGNETAQRRDHQRHDRQQDRGGHENRVRAQKNEEVNISAIVQQPNKGKAADQEQKGKAYSGKKLAEDELSGRKSARVEHIEGPLLALGRD